MITLVLIATGFIVLLVLAISFLLGRRINAPLQRLVDAFGSTGLTNLNRRLTIESEDEIGCLALHFNRFMDNLEQDSIRRRILIDQSRDGIAVLDQFGKVYEANQSFADMLGYSLEELHQLHVWDWDARWTREELEERFRLIETVENRFETRHRRRDGTLYDVEISLNVATVGSRKLVFTGCRDITERKQAEENLRLTQFSLEYAADPIFWIGSEAQLLYANEAACRSLGYSKEEILSLSVPDIDPFFDAAKWPDFYEQWKQGHFLTFESAHRRKDGSIFPIEVNINNLAFDGKEFNLVFVRDISESKRAEEEKEEAGSAASPGTETGSHRDTCWRHSPRF